MSSDGQAARDDLAFLRTLVGDDENPQMRTFGETYFAAGLIYGGQMILHAVQARGYLPADSATGLAIGLGPTLVFLPVMALILHRNRKYPMRGAVGRAVGGVFGAVGIANLVLAAVIGAAALRQHSVDTWLIFPCAVLVLQGTAWFFTYMMRRRFWHLLVAVGWYACAIAAALALPSIPYFILFVGLGLWVCMALPGWILLRNTRGR
ncbi:MAG TPA: hypothetical protein VGC36_12645 [Rhizomicrobium sp.]